MTATNDGNSNFVHLRDSFEHWVSHVWHSDTAHQIVVAAEDGGEEVGKAAFQAAAAAAVTSHLSGGNKDAVQAAATHAALTSLQTVGLSVGTEVVTGAVKALSASIHGTPAADDPGAPQA